MHDPTRRRRVAVRFAVSIGAAAALTLATALPANAAGPVSQATAQAVNIGILSGAANVALSNPATAASNDGTGSNTPVNAAPLVSALNAQSFLAAGALNETAEANQNGSSYACSGVASPNGGIQVGTGGTTCTPTGNGTGGVTLDLSQIPGVGGLLGSLFSLKLTADSVIAHAHDDGTTASGDASIAGLKAVACVLVLGNCVAPITVPVTIPSGVNQNLLTAVITALSGQSALSGLVNLLSNSIAPIVSLQTNYQTTSNGVLSVSALHVTLLGGSGATADVAKVTVGPNAPQAPTPMFSMSALPIALAVLAVVGLGLVAFRRQLRPQRG